MSGICFWVSLGKDVCWIKGHHKDKKIHNFNKGNFERGQSFEKFALDLFEKVIANQWMNMGNRSASWNDKLDKEV